MRKALLALGCLVGLAGPAAGTDPSCGEAGRCAVAGGEYRIALPAAPVRGGPEHARDDQAYLRSVLADIRKRHRFNPENTLIGGFSLGASMAWYAACEQGSRFAGMITFSGVFWDPLPKPSDCTAGLPPLIHIHGRADRTFPLEGRAIGTHFHQGDTFRSLEIYRERASCATAEAARRLTADLDCNIAPSCARGTSMLCLHPGGHVVRSGDLDAALSDIGYPR